MKDDNDARVCWKISSAHFQREGERGVGREIGREREGERGIERGVRKEIVQETEKMTNNQ